jgi:hypothetical protein
MRNLGIAGLIVLAGIATGCASSSSVKVASAPSSSVSSAAPAAAPSSTDGSLAAVYASACKVLADGISPSQVASIADQQLQQAGITGYTGEQLVEDAEKHDCPQYLSSSSPAAPATTQAPAVTVSEQQALDAAKNYLSDGTGFSRQGLIDQLDSSAGDGFSKADATWAVDHSGADWDAQAVDAARNYMQMGGFSRSSLIDQLTSAYGDQFTLAQATYAANKVGL